MKTKLLTLFLLTFGLLCSTSYSQLAPVVKSSDGTIYSMMPVGVVLPFAGSNAPTGWLICNGANCHTNTHPVLFAAIGYNFGGSTTNFILPDMRGVFPKGAGTTDRVAGKDAKTNAYSAILGTYYQDKLQGHWHQNAHSTDRPLAAGTYDYSWGYGEEDGDGVSGVRNPMSDTINGTRV